MKTNITSVHAKSFYKFKVKTKYAHLTCLTESAGVHCRTDTPEAAAIGDVLAGTSIGTGITVTGRHWIENKSTYLLAVYKLVKGD